MDPLPNVTVCTAEAPLLSLQDDGRWVLEFEDAGVAVILESAQVRSIVDSFLSQQLGGPEE